MTTPLLPIAQPAEVRRAAARLVRADKVAFAAVVLLSCAAATAGLAAPWLVGQIVNEVQTGGGAAAIDRWGLLVVLAAVGQFTIGYGARYLGYRFGERTSARLREQLTDRLMRLPARTVERAATGDLTSRATIDVGLVAFVLRDAAPEVLFALIQAVIIVTAVFLLSPLLGVVALVALAAIPVALRWYLRRARTAYLAQGAADAEVADVLASTAAGARTVEALGLQQRRRAACRCCHRGSKVQPAPDPSVTHGPVPDHRRLQRARRRCRVLRRRLALPRPGHQSRHRGRRHSLPAPARLTDRHLADLGRDPPEQPRFLRARRRPRDPDPSTRPAPDQHPSTSTSWSTTSTTPTTTATCCTASTSTSVPGNSLPWWVCRVPGRPRWDD